MKLFKSGPALVALLCAVFSLAVTVALTLWPVLAAAVPATVLPLIVFVLFVILLVLHYEKMLKDAAAVAAGQIPVSTLVDDFKTALSEGFGNVAAQVMAQAKADLGPQTAVDPMATVTAAVTAVGELTQGAQTIAAAAATLTPAPAAQPAP